MGEATSKRLHASLVKLGDMMGDGLHHEPEGKRIAREYALIAKALGYGPKRRKNSEAINVAMAGILAKALCSKCSGALKQTKSGALRAVCVSCGARFQFGRSIKGKSGG